VRCEQRAMVQALARVAGVPRWTIATVSPAIVAHRGSLRSLLVASSPALDLAQPYAFHPCGSLDCELEALGPANAWQAEWKWDGSVRSSSGVATKSCSGRMRKNS